MSGGDQGQRGSSPGDDALRALGELMARNEESRPGTTAAGAAPRSGGHPSGPASPDPVANEAGLLALGREVDRAQSRRSRKRPARGRRRHRVRTGVLIGLAVLLVLVGSGAGYAYSIPHELNRVDV